MKYPLFKAHVPPEAALSGIREVFKSGFLNEGVQVTELSQALGSFLNAPHLTLMNSCTSALTVALRLAGARPGTTVVSSPMTCVASNTPIVNAGARIVWADIDPNTGMLDPDSVAKRIAPDTVVVLVVAWAGTPPELDALRSVCTKHGIPLILDAAHAFGAEYQGRPVHVFADHTAYSFQAIKHFTTGDGGALVCRDPFDHHRARALKWFGLDRDRVKDAQGNWKGQQWDTDVVLAGYKFNMNNVAATIGLSQLPHIGGILEAHRRNAAICDDLFVGAAHVRPVVRPAGGKGSFWVYPMRTVGISRDDLLSRLNAEGIQAGLVHVPNDAYTAFASSKADLPGVREFASTQFCLPCGWWLTEDDVRHIAGRVLELSR